MNDSFGFLIVISPIIGVSIASTYYVTKLIQDRKERKPIFSKFQRKKDIVEGWQIFVHSPTKPVRQCYATFRGQKLPLWDGKGYERTIALGEGVNFTMPKDVSKDDDGMILIKSGKQTIEKSKFSEMETVNG